MAKKKTIRRNKRLSKRSKHLVRRNKRVSKRSNKLYRQNKKKSRRSNKASGWHYNWNEGLYYKKKPGEWKKLQKAEDKKKSIQRKQFQDRRVTSQSNVPMSSALTPYQREGLEPLGKWVDPDPNETSMMDAMGR